MKRFALKLVMFLLLGAILNVAVAWGCAVWSPLGASVDLTNDEWCDLIRAQGGDPEDCRLLYAHRRTGWGLAAIDHGETCGEWRNTLVTPSFGIFGPFTYRAGLPTPTVQGMWIHNRAPVDGITPPPFLRQAASGFFQNDRILPLRPLWPGFAINTIFYAAILWLPFAALGAFRRRRRIKGGLCPRCGYDLRGITSQTCPECGAIASQPS